VSAETESGLPRRILLLDADQFFVQVARLIDPEGAGREPLLLVGGAADARGVVCSASYETRRFGVRSGMPMSRALRLCPRAKVVPVPRGECGARSRAIVEVLRRYAPVVEAASIDEAYLDLTGTEALYGGRSLDDVALEIQASVLEETRIVVSLGGGTSKLVAKMASRLAKPGGVYCVEPGREAEFMARFRLGDLPGVGPVQTRELERRGLTTVAQAQALDEAALCRILGEERGAWLYRRVRGLDDSPVVASREQKQLSREETFPRDLDRDDDLGRELLALACRVGADLRADGRRARTVTVKVRDADFRTRQASRTLPDPIESDRAILAVARELFAKLRSDRPGPIRLLGVGLSHLGGETDGDAQLGLFGEEMDGGIETDRDRALSHAVDRLRERFGSAAVRPAGLIRGSARRG